jgi:hypothetical protein
MATSWPVAVIVLAASVLLGHYAARVSEWTVMTDELQVERLGLSVHDGALWPTIHGVGVPIYSQLYPLLSAPFYLLPLSDAFHALHVFNAVLMASTAVPVYLTARLVGADRLAGAFAGAMTVLVPWVVLSTTLLTEVVAYPAFAWAVYLLVRTLATPSPASDAFALLGLALAVLARTQFVVLVVAAPLAVALHAALFGGRLTAGAVVGRLRAGVLEHPVLLTAYGLGLCGVALRWATGGELQSVLGSYSDTATGDLLPPGVVDAAVSRLDVVAVGAGYLPLVFAMAWIAATLVRPATKSAHAFSVVAVILVPALVLEAASFDLRFTAGGFVQDRYLFYIAPLLFVGTVMLLAEGGRQWIALAVSGVVAAWLVGRTGYAPSRVIFWASPAGAFHGVLEGRSQQLGSYVGASDLSAAQLLRWGTLPAVLAVGLLLHTGRARAALVIVGVALCAFLFVETRYVLVRVAMPIVTRPSTPPMGERGWIDRAVPDGATVALVPSSSQGPDAWWDAEFWNVAVRQQYMTPGATPVTPFPAEPLELGGATGGVRAAKQTPWLVTPVNEVRFGLMGSRTLASNGPLVLLRVPLPYRLDWATRGGLYEDGWTQPGQDVLMDVFAPPEAGRQRRRVRLDLLNTAGITRAQPYTVSVDGAVRARGSVAPGQRLAASVVTCPPTQGHSRVALRVRGSAPITDGRSAGLLLYGVRTAAAGPC